MLGNEAGGIGVTEIDPNDPAVGPDAGAARAGLAGPSTSGAGLASPSASGAAILGAGVARPGASGGDRLGADRLGADRLGAGLVRARLLKTKLPQPGTTRINLQHQLQLRFHMKGLEAGTGGARPSRMRRGRPTPGRATYARPGVRPPDIRGHPSALR